MYFYRLLSFKLFVLVFIILIILTIGFSLYYIKTESEQYAEIARQCAFRTSEIVAGSTRNSMLLNAKESTYSIMKGIVQQEGIQKVTLFDKTGRIAYSTAADEINHTADYEARECSPCHESSGSLRKKPIEAWHHIYKNEQDQRLMVYIRPIANEASCYQSSCHAHQQQDTYLGLLRITLSLSKMDSIVEQNRSRMISTNIAITLVLALMVGIMIWFFVHVPVKKLILGTKQISSGNLSYQIISSARDEIGSLAQSFNQMTQDLREAKQEITSWSNQLEHRVQEKTVELEHTQKRNLQIEKMASLGQLSATVAHELNNPIAGILTYSKLIQKKLAKGDMPPAELEAILKYMKMIESESERSGNIVKNMLLFSRQEAIEIKTHDLHQVIDNSIQLIDHHLKLHNIKLVREFHSDLPPVEIDDNQIKQALLALFVNAVEAMEDEGILTIRTELRISEQAVYISVKDTGKGIADDLKSQIFEPFYTTKNAVKGVGLGLSAVYAIIQRHRGEIWVESEINKGSTFIIKIPLKQSKVS
jgi:two-component system NtrC family sensor kinase